MLRRACHGLKGGSARYYANRKGVIPQVNPSQHPSRRQLENWPFPRLCSAPAICVSVEHIRRRRCPEPARSRAQFERTLPSHDCDTGIRN
jgi:hypothetical protein